jgi:hypothetical protein
MELYLHSPYAFIWWCLLIKQKDNFIIFKAYFGKHLPLCISWRCGHTIYLLLFELKVIIPSWIHFVIGYFMIPPYVLMSCGIEVKRVFV